MIGRLSDWIAPPKSAATLPPSPPLAARPEDKKMEKLVEQSQERLDRALEVTDALLKSMKRDRDRDIWEADDEP